MSYERFARVVDLFVEGAEAYLGDDPKDGSPVLIWMNKLNSFEVEEARADGMARRSEAIIRLGKPDSPERLAMEAELGMLGDEALAKQFVEAKSGEIYLEVVADIQTDEAWRERMERIQRLPGLLDDSVPADDPRRVTLQEDQDAWVKEIDVRQKKKEADAVEDALEMGREALEKAFYEAWRDRSTVNQFMEEKRTTELWLAMRQCVATKVSTGVEEAVWDHSKCDHSQRILADRNQLKRLPDPVIRKAVEALERVTVSPRQAGKSDAPPSSSVSSEPSSIPEEESTPSTPTETPAEPPTS